MQLSIITINYNNCDGLKKTIDSVVSQTFNGFEWIVIDGGSTDGSKELIERYSSHLAYWVSEPDKGIYNAMNKGIKVAQGEYLMFLNSGDYLYEDVSLEKVFRAGLDADVVCGDVLVETGEKRFRWPNLREVTMYTFIYGTIAHSGGSFIQKSLFDRYGLYDESLCIVSDWKFFLQAIGLGDASVKCINVIISVFDNHGLSSSMKSLHIEEKNSVLNECVPQRILKDYRMMEDERKRFVQTERQIRSSASYRLGKAILGPLKWMKHTLSVHKRH